MSRRPSRPGDPLTVRQREVLAFICDSLRTRGYPPTLREILDHLGLPAKQMQAATDHLYALWKKGFIADMPRGGGVRGAARAIRVLRTDDGRPIVLGVADAERDDLLAYFDVVVRDKSPEVA